MALREGQNPRFISLISAAPRSVTGVCRGDDFAQMGGPQRRGARPMEQDLLCWSVLGRTGAYPSVTIRINWFYF